MNYKPLVSIITATFNAENDLEACIKSVISQSYTNLEFIIVDGGSTDGTLEIIRKYEKYISVYISEKDKGIYDAWNKGIKLANGDWIAFLGADDLYMPNAIENYINHISRLDYLNLDMISSKIMLVNEKKSKLRVIGQEWKWKTFRRYMCTAHVGSLHSKSFFEKYGLYNINYKIVGDYEILLRAKDLLKASFLNEITVNMKVGGISNLDNRAVTETMKAKVENKVSGFCLAKYDYYKANFIFYVRKIIKRV